MCVLRGKETPFRKGRKKGEDFPGIGILKSSLEKLAVLPPFPFLETF